MSTPPCRAIPAAGLARLARFVVRHRLAVVSAWLLLTLLGGFAAGRIHFSQSFGAPGSSAYETSKRTLATFGVGMRPPVVVVFHTDGDARASAAIRAAAQRAARANPRALTSSYFSTGDPAYVSRDHHTTFVEIYPPGPEPANPNSGATRTRTATAAGLPAAIGVHVTGYEPLEEADMHGQGGDRGVLFEALIGGIGALAILLFVFGTLPAVLMPVAVAVAAILNTFTLVWTLSAVTNVSVIVEYLVALVGLGVAIDYSLLMIFRFREELRAGADPKSALVKTMTHAGRSVLVSGSTVALGLLALLVVPLPFVRSMGMAGLLIPAVSVIATITLLPALLALLGRRIDSVRLLPRRLVDRGHPEQSGWGRWARTVLRRPLPAALAGLAIVGVLAVAGTRLNPNEPQLANFPGSGDAIVGREALAAAGISPGVMKPLDVLVAHGDPAAVASRLRTVAGISAAVAPTNWRRADLSLVQAFPAIDGAAPGIRGIIDRTQSALAGSGATVGGVAAVDRVLVDSLWSNFPAMLALLLTLTLVLLARAFRSPLLALKATLLNLLSLGAAFGIVVLAFQDGHGSSLWNFSATHAIVGWIPLMLFAFLYGLSMDYEVFMLTRIREAYDQTGSTNRAIELGLARTGKLVTSGALILMFAFLVLSTSPGFEITELAIGLAAGIVLDATVIRALLVPALMRLLGRANWWLPDWARTALLIRDREPAPQLASPEEA